MNFPQFYTMHENGIKDYCIAHNYDFDKLKHMPKCVNFEHIVFLYSDENKGQQGLKDDKTRMPVVLWVYFNNDGKLTFEETEHTKKYIMN